MKTQNPSTQAEHLSQRQVEYLAAIPIEEDDSVAGEDDLACITCEVHKRSYISEPCGHFVMCGRCVSVHRHSVNDNDLDVPLAITCPVCRRTLAGYRRIYQ
ncbi:E3 ubiquitin-protein ligase SPL2-like [Nilaparvata lugens]|uniref:E3 ubiquitin-protein ligase SPL2-like n=1 Tax=Nilaparvata lugens TaxID=108931 RepID=UPI00193CADDA|nr:E3 ubiquitin-protein ligase SPL2-like [Nilaparvata lugens]